MSLEQSIQNLADAINTLAASAYRTAVASEAQLPPETAAVTVPKRGRPAKESTVPASAAATVASSAGATSAPPSAPAAAPSPAAAAAKVAERIAAVSAEAEAPQLTKGDVQKLLIRIVNEISKEACTSACMKYGAPNLGALDPSVYPDLHADALSLLEAVGG